MAFASAIHHRPCVRAPLMFDPGRLGGSSVSSLRRHALAAAPRDPARSCRFCRLSIGIPWAKGTDQEDISVAEDKEKNNSSSHDEVNIIGVAIRDPVSCGTESTLADKSSSMKTVALWVFAASAFGICLGFKDGIEKASEFFAGYILEQSLSVDNLFVFVLIFSYFKVPVKCQSQVLSYGIAGAIIFRAVVILLGTATIQRFELVNVLLALILLFSSYKLFSAEEEEADLADNFIVKTCQKFIPVTDYYDGGRFFTIKDGVRKATPLLLALAVVELSDIAFAVDSIPAVFGVTRDPFIVFSSNLFAICGLRSLYVLISESMSEMEYLQPAIGVVLGFIGTKMLFDFFGYHVSTEASLCFVAITLGTGVLLSLRKNQSD
ncbi:thylakoid membrane protein TERC, chloroplastic-like [Zingiber officinale]|uniref:thylakoid membrane protein TERC, chloroplastic-like n=1 Tax=Zingiber officinale TaxID=94328 RepID=UPI001C4D13FA|nr:thylakoid membrane protein TERC, chloroplastic-like [Zingiber officinale]